MLFAVTYVVRPGGTDESERRTLQVFGGWTPPQGYQFQAHYTRADGRGGIAIVENDSAAALLEAAAPFATYLEFEVVPIVDITEGVAVLQRVQSWRDAVR